MAQYGTWKWSGRSSRGWCVCVCLCVVLCCALCIKCTTKDLSDEPVFSKLRSHLIDVYGARQRQTVLSQMHHKMIEKMKWKPTTIPNVLGKIILLIWLWLYIKWTACNFWFFFSTHFAKFLLHFALHNITFVNFDRFCDAFASNCFKISRIFFV